MLLSRSIRSATNGCWTHIPMDKVILRKWLKAGFLEKHVLFATTEGTPQGGIISPALANRALDGLERLLAEHFAHTPRASNGSKVHLVRYADDFIITGTSKDLLRDEVQPLVAHFLKERGLELSHEKTRITHVEDGFDFLGQNVRRYRSGKVLIKPSKRSVKTFLAKIQETIDDSGSQTAGELIRRLNQQIKGWTMYHRHAASKRTFSTWIDRIFRMLWRWCRRRHREKSRKWIRTKYFQRDGHRDWVFTGTLRDQKGQGWPIQLMAAAKVRIIRHVKIRSEPTPTIRSGNCTWKTAGLATGPDAGRSRSDRIPMEGARGTMRVCGQPLRSRRRTGRSIIGSGAAEAVRTRRTTWSCSMPTAIGRSTCKNDGRKRPRPARGVREGLSWMRGNSHVQF